MRDKTSRVDAVGSGPQSNRSVDANLPHRIGGHFLCPSADDPSDEAKPTPFRILESKGTKGLGVAVVENTGLKLKAMLGFVNILKGECFIH